MLNLKMDTTTEKKPRPRKGPNVKIIDGKEIILGASKEEAYTRLDAFVFEPGVPKTLKQWMLEFGYDHWVLSRHIRDNAKIVGKAHTTTPGKKPDLYEFPA